MPNEPVVRIRTPTPEDAARCRAALASAGLAAEESLTWLLVRDGSPDAVNEILVAGGALGRTVGREQVGKLVGFLIDHGADLGTKGPQLGQLVRRTLSDTGLSGRYAPRPEPALVEAARALHERLMATAGGFVSWDEFVAGFCEVRGG